MEQGIWWSKNKSGKKAERTSKRESAIKKSSFRFNPGQADLKGSPGGKLLSPERRRQCIHHLQGKLKISKRRACKVIGQHRSTQRYNAVINDSDIILRSEITRLAKEYGRYGYRMITGMLKNDGWHINHKRVERIWRQEGLKVPRKQPKRGRLWLNDGTCIRLRPRHINHVWAYDFCHGQNS